MVRLSKALVATMLALSVVMTPVLSQKATTMTKGGATATASVNPATPTINFILPSAAPAPATPSANPSNNNTDLQPAPQQKACPALLIPDPNPGVVTPGQSCAKGCCIRCPAINSFYEPNRVENVLKGAYFTRQASLGFAIFMAISYLVLPGKRSQPHISVLFLTVSLSLWYAAFDIMPGYSNACIDDLNQSTGKNSRMCGAQGVLIVYLTQTSALWCSLLIYKLHLVTYNAHYGWFTAFCWVFPLAFAIPVAVKNLAEYPGIGFSCLVGTKNLNTYLFYPVAAYMYPAMICHVVTVGKMIRLAVMSSRIDTGLSQLSTDARMKVTTTMQAKRLLRGQWRPALMVGGVMASLTIFWLFYFVDTHSFSQVNAKTPWLGAWFMCLWGQEALHKSADEMQAYCAVAAQPNLPSIHWFAAAEILMALLGVVVAAVFITKAEFWEEWSYLLSNLVRRGKTGESRPSSRGSRSNDDHRNGSNSPTMVNRHPSSSSNSNTAGEIARKGGPMARGASSGGLHNDMHGGGPNGPGGVFRTNSQSMSTKNLTTINSQWYDMDDLLDKEYELQQHQQQPSLQHASSSQLHRNVSFSSRTGMTSAAADPPKYTSSHLNSNSISNNDAGSVRSVNVDGSQQQPYWTPSAHTLTSPTRAYFNASTSDRGTMDRYSEKPVVPSPVPRTPRLNTAAAVASSSPITSQNIFLSSPTKHAHSPTSPPQSPTASYRSQSNINHPLDSVPIIGVAMRGSPAMASSSPNMGPYQTLIQQRSYTPSSPSSPGLPPPRFAGGPAQTSTAASLLYNPNNSSDQIFVASRESIGRTPLGMGLPMPATSPTTSVKGARARSPPPSLPNKNPHRHHQPGYMSPPIHIPPTSPTSSSNNNNFYRE
ncbi:hypothetical protein BGX33_010402 [Mortierella sp. NVP41]|nr:hypothetical protein BGX33_010402 [Mortierella sp. NVP41]